MTLILPPATFSTYQREKGRERIASVSECVIVLRFFNLLLKTLDQCGERICEESLIRPDLQIVGR